MPIEYCLGIDLGTSGIKTILLDREGKRHGMASGGYKIYRPVPGWAEQDPYEWWSAVRAAVSESVEKSGVNPRKISGIGVSGQMHGGVFVDSQMSPLGPAIIWADGRSRLQVREIYDRVGRMRLGKIARSPVAPGFMAPTLLWLRQEAPDIFGKIRHALFPKDYIKYLITGNIGTEASDASASLLFDTSNRRWSDALLEALELDKGILPETGRSAEICGKVTSSAAGQLGLMEGIPVVRGSGDTPAAAIGNGIIEPGVVSVTLGAGGQVVAALDEPLYDPELRTHTFCHASPDLWYIMGAILAGGMSLTWLRQLLGEHYSFARFDELARKTPAGGEGLFFMPYLIGERTPHMDPQARGALIGLLPRHGAGHVARAVMEGVAYALKDSFEILKTMGISPDKVIAGGSGGASQGWRQIIADVLGVDLRVTSDAASSAIGAAIIAAVGVGAFPSIPEACKTMTPELNEITRPNPENAEIYRKGYSIYRSLYPANEPIFHVISNLI